MNSYGFALYLTDEDNKELFPIITRLQKEYDNAPPFEPHLSVHTSVRTELSNAIKAVDEIVAGIKKFSVEKTGFGYQNSWSKILYIKIKELEILTKIHTSIGIKLGSVDPRPYIPHISLMYKDELTPKKRSEIIESLDVPTKFTIKGIEIMGSDTPDLNWRDYAKWTVEYRKDFD